MKILATLGVLGVLCVGAVGATFFMWRSSTQIYYVASSSMLPTLRANDRVIVDKRAYRDETPKRGEIVVFAAPPAALVGQTNFSQKQVDFMMRVVAVPGDKVEVIGRRVYINKRNVSDPNGKWSGPYHYDCKVVDGQVYTKEYEGNEGGLWTKNRMVATEQEQISQASAGPVPPHHFFVLGDNRTNSNDSHMWGFVPRERLIGRVTSIIYPENHQRSF